MVAFLPVLRVHVFDIVTILDEDPGRSTNRLIQRSVVAILNSRPPSYASTIGKRQTLTKLRNKKQSTTQCNIAHINTIMTTTFRINDAVAFVTGTNKKNGIGRSIVDALLANGAKKVYATARDASQLDELVQIAGGRVVAVSLDVADKDQIASLGGLYPDVNLLINNAGYAGYAASAFENNTLDEAVKEIEVNYFGPLRINHSFAKNLKGKTNTAVVNVASIASFVNFNVAGTYSASKAAIHSLTQAQRRDFGHETLVVGVYPGPIDTDMADGLPFDKTPPSAVATAIVDALLTGKEDVFPDGMAVQLHNGWQADAKAMEVMMATPQPAEPIPA